MPVVEDIYSDAVEDGLHLLMPVGSLRCLLELVLLEGGTADADF